MATEIDTQQARELHHSNGELNMETEDKREHNLESLLRSYNITMQLVNKLINDETTEILEYYENKPGNKFENVFDCTLYAVTNFYGCINLFPEDILRALQVVRECLQFISARRKKWSLTSAMAQTFKSKSIYSTYTEEETQAEICYAALMIMRGGLNFIRDNNILTMISGSLKLKTAYSSFESCKKLLKHHKSINEDLERFFTESTKFGIGISNLIFANVPKRLLRILEFVGFSGDRAVGLKALRDGCGDENENPNLGALMCFASLVIYHMWCRYVLGNGTPFKDIKDLENLVHSYTKRYPESTGVAYMNGRLLVLKGQIDEAMVWLQTAISKETNRMAIQLFPIWELSACYILKGEPRKAAHLVHRLRVEVNVSKCCFSYLQAIYLLSIPDITDDEKKLAIQLLTDTPNLMAEYCGKHIPFEKQCVRKARQFFAQENFLFLPEYEFLYLVNYFMIAKFSKERLNFIMKQVDDLLKFLDNRKDWQFYPDNYCLGMLIKGVCSKYLNKEDEAKLFFQQIISMENEIFSDVYLIMCAHLELGIMDTAEGNLEEALLHFKLAKKQKMFWVEFRIHTAKEDVVEMIKQKKKMSKLA